MKKGMLKKAMCTALAVTMTLSLTACFGGGKDDPSQAVADAKDMEAAKEAVYKEVGQLRPDCDWFDQVLVNGNDIVVVWSEYIDNSVPGGEAYPEEEVVPYTEEPVIEEPVTEEPAVEEGVVEEPVIEEDVVIPDEGVGEDVMMPEVEYDPEYEYHFNMEINFGKVEYGGTNMSTTCITLPEDEYSSFISIDKSNGNYIIVSEHGEDDYSDPNNYKYVQHFYMNVYSPYGEQLSREEIDFGTEESVGIYGMGVCSNGDICVATYNKVYVLDSSLKMVGTISFNTTQWIEGFYMTEDGTPYVYVWDESANDNSYSFHAIDTMQLRTGSAITPPSNFWGGARPGAGHDLYYSTDRGVYCFDFSTGEEKKLMDFVDSDVDYALFSFVMPVDEEHFVMVMNDSETWENYVAFYDKVPPEEVKDKTIITMGMLYIDYEVREKVIEFNKSSDTYRIRMIEYYEYNNESDWTAGLKMFNNDIITSNAPDIVVLNTELPVASYMEKGVLMNLTPFIEADSEISLEDMAPNVVSLGSVGEDVYFLTQSYTVSTMAMKESLVPNGSTLTLGELRQVENNLGNVQAFQTVTRDDIIRYAMEMNYSEFLDVASGKCEFNTPAFHELLEYAKQYPAEIDWESMGDDYWMEQQYAMRDNKALLQYFSIADFRSVAYTEQGTFGEKMAFVGFPGSEGNCGVLYPYVQMAISKDCECPEEAWQFMRQFYTYEAQCDLDYGIPVNLKAMDEKIAEAQQRPYWIDENGNKVEYDDTFWMGDQEIIIDPITTERAQEVKAYVLSVDKIYYYDSAIIDIITEEAAPFFAGQKTAQQAADIIQSRVQIYVNENR